MKASSGDDNVQSTTEQSKKVQAEAYIRKVRRRFGGKSKTFHAFVVLLRDFRYRRTDAASLGVKITQLFYGHDDLILKFNDFMPRCDDDDDDKDDNNSEKTTTEYPVEVLQAIDFVNKVKIRFRNNGHVYEAFLQIINQIREGCAECESCINEVEALLKDHPDLLQEFGRIIGRIILDSAASHSAIDGDSSVNPDKENPDKENPGLVLGEDKSSKRSDYKQRFTFCEKIKNMLCSSSYQALLKHLQDYSSGKLDRDGLKVVIEELLKDKLDLVNLQDFLKCCESTNKSEILEEIKDKKHKGKCEILEETKQDMLKPVHELDFSKSQEVSPSYWFLPENYCMPLTSHRSKIGNQVLNDCLVCVNSGSGCENYSKQRHITQQEKILFRCEDDRFEMDLLLEYATSASESVKKLLMKINKDQIKTSAIKLEDYLSIFELRCIERLYGEHGLDMMELLHNDPAAALPTILCRLNQKREELKMCRSDFDKVWAYVHAKNQLELLEKQHELKNLNTEPVVTQFQENEKKMQKEEDKGSNTMI